MGEAVKAVDSNRQKKLFSGSYPAFDCVLFSVASMLFGIICGVSLLSSSWVRSDLTTGNLFQSLTTLASATIVALFLQKRMGDRSKMKDLFIKECESLCDSLDLLEKIEFPVEITDLASSLKIISMRCGSLSKSARGCGFSEEVCGLLLLKEERLNIRDMLTNTPVRGSDQESSGVSVKQSIVTLTPGKELSFRACVNHTKHKIFEAKILIGRH